MQEIDQDQLSTTVKNYLFKVNEDPNEDHNLADKHPQIVAGLSKKIQQWRALSPINATRSIIAPPPGWRAPLDWASYPRPLNELQSQATIGVAPSENSLRALDYMHGERGRLMYDCPPPKGSLTETLTSEPKCEVTGKFPGYR